MDCWAVFHRHLLVEQEAAACCFAVEYPLAVLVDQAQLDQACLEVAGHRGTARLAFECLVVASFRLAVHSLDVMKVVESCRFGPSSVRALGVGCSDPSCLEYVSFDLVQCYGAIAYLFACRSDWVRDRHHAGCLAATSLELQMLR